MNIFIAGVDYRYSDADLQNLFSEFGTVTSAKIIMDRETGRSKGFGFVEMQDDQEGQHAIDELNEKELEGKKLSVSVARPREEGRSGGRGGYNGGGNRGGGYGGGNRGGGYGGGRGRY
ncbi:RNA recognition motif domain-containing protein [Phocaeicola sp.]